jgi:hypothetical protein
LDHRQTLFQLALWITVPINFTGAVIFSVPALRQLIGLPVPVHPLYSVLIGTWIGLFGLGYLRLAITKSTDKTFLAVGALGKLSFFLLALFYFFQADLGILALIASVIDAVVAAIVLFYINKS